MANAKPLPADDGTVLQLPGLASMEPTEFLRIVGNHATNQNQGEAEAGNADGWGGVSQGVRRILVDWLVLAHTRIGFSDSSLEVAVAILDKFCSLSRDVTTKNLQLYGVAALLIASKIHEHEVLDISLCVTLTQCSFTHDQVVQAEARMLEVLEFDVMIPTPGLFVGMLSQLCSLPGTVVLYSGYFVFKALLETPVFVLGSPLLVGAACVYIALTKSFSPSKAAMFGAKAALAAGRSMEEIARSAERISSMVSMAPSHTKSKRKLNAVELKFSHCC